ncbi:hypothetical protein SDC9_160466 [bioreactor metagenome]|uniref:Uncharacterized protein n=1 Tax=bioreactor metagenome TaxID=1076179 RepID=A0A645FHN5_9ZZZZ
MPNGLRRSRSTARLPIQPPLHPHIRLPRQVFQTRFPNCRPIRSRMDIPSQVGILLSVEEGTHLLHPVKLQATELSMPSGRPSSPMTSLMLPPHQTRRLRRLSTHRAMTRCRACPQSRKKQGMCLPAGIPPPMEEEPPSLPIHSSQGISPYTQDGPHRLPSTVEVPTPMLLLRRNWSTRPQAATR